MNFPDGWHVKRKSDGVEGYVSNAWTQDDGTDLVFVGNMDGTGFVSPGCMGEPASLYESDTPVHAPDIERKAGRRYRGILPSFASLGGYPLIYLTRGSDVLCADCATEQIDTGNDTNDDPVIDVDVFYEGADEVCANCNKHIPSAYGDPDADDMTDDSDQAADDAALARIEGSIYP
jgi:hypothetical protein